MNALIIGSLGCAHSARLVARLAPQADLVLAADGGGALCLEAGVVPDVVVGDLDSLSRADEAALRESGARFVVFPTEKDETDLDLAIAEARVCGADHVLATGVLGGRVDHTLASLGSLVGASDLAPIVVEPDMTAWVLSAEGRAQVALHSPGATVSLFAFEGPATVTCQGFRYPLHAATLRALSSLGVSNVITSDEATIELHAGTLIVFAVAPDGSIEANSTLGTSAPKQ
jgi:thiamine pyrophosphokinase